MYRRFALDVSDKNFHRNIWRDTPQEPIKHLKMIQVTYEIASSAFQSTRCLQEIGTMTADEDLKQTTQNNFYVDEKLREAASIDEAH